MGLFEILEDDLTGSQTRALLAIHLAGMRAHSPPDGVSALGLSGLQNPDVTVWTVWRGGRAIGIGALKCLPGGGGELKCMRTHSDHLRQGVAAALLAHIIAVARERGLARLSLETGSGAAFEPALAFYRRHGFTNGAAFSDYEKSGFNQFLHRPL